MHYKSTTPFNEKPLRSRKKKTVTEVPQSECLKFSFNSHGNLKEVMDKSGWIMVSKDNAHHLCRVETILFKRGDKDTDAYKGISAEIEQRISRGELTPAEIEAHKRRAE